MDFNDCLAQQGYAWMRSCIDLDQIQKIVASLEVWLAHNTESGIYSGDHLIGARNLIETWSDGPDLAVDLLRKFALKLYHPASDISSLSVVRLLYFDKPPGKSWSLPLHRDESIAVKDHPSELPSGFSRPTTKVGVKHLIASTNLLQQMFAMRLHLDPMSRTNGQLYVVPGSHRDDSSASVEHDDNRAIIAIEANAGDLLIMRPRLLHGSFESQAGCELNRRVLHFEVAPTDALPAPLQWQWSLR
jgi:hypothetical protein